MFEDAIRQSQHTAEYLRHMTLLEKILKAIEEGNEQLEAIRKGQKSVLAELRGAPTAEIIPDPPKGRK